MPSLEDLSFTTTPDEVRLTFAVDRATAYQERTTPKEWRLFLPGVAKPTVLPAFADSVLAGFAVRTEGTGLSLVIPWRYWCPTTLTWLPDDLHLEVRFRKIYREVATEPVGAGVVHEHVRAADARGPLNMHVLRIDPAAEGVRVSPAMAGGGFFGRERVGAIVRRAGALAGVNGAYFSTKTGEPLGLLMIDGQLVAGPLYNRSAIAFGATGIPVIAQTQLATRLVLPGGESYDFDGVNQPRGLNRMVLYTAHYGATTFTTGGTEFALGPDGTVVAIGPGPTAIPVGGQVVAAHGQAAEWLTARVRPGQTVKLLSALGEFWPGVRHALGGGPTLLKDGQVVVNAASEQFKADIAQGTAPRTAVATTTTGEVLLVTVDGRLPGFSRGLTLTELAVAMRDLGAHEALNLDGGGSTAMVIGENTVNQPSEGEERPVNNALLVFGAGTVGAKAPTDAHLTGSGDAASAGTASPPAR